VLPLTDAVTLFFANPLIVTALAAPLLGEAVGWRRRAWSRRSNSPPCPGALLWGALLWGALLFHEIPGPWAGVGMALVIGAGLYIVRRETVLGKRVVRGPKPWRFRA